MIGLEHGFLTIQKLGYHWALSWKFSSISLQWDFTGHARCLQFSDFCRQLIFSQTKWLMSLDATGFSFSFFTVNSIVYRWKGESENWKIVPIEYQRWFLWSRIILTSVHFGWFSQVWPAGSAGNLQRPTTALAERNMSQHHVLQNQHVVSAG